MIRIPAHKGDMKMIRLMYGALVVVTLGVAAAVPAWAGSDERKGTDGALELMLPVGARGSALGGSVVSDVTGTEAIYWNPAGHTTIERPEVLFTHTNYFADMKINYAAVATKVGGLGVLGFNAKVLSIGDVIVTTEDAPDGTGQILDPTFTVLGMSWARQFTDRVSFGATVNYVNEHIAEVSANGVAFDFGVQYATGWHGLRFGMVMKNFGPSMSFGGPGFETNILPPGSDPTAQNRTFSATSASFDMPSYFTLAASYNVASSAAYRLTALGAFQNNNFSGDNVRGGLEWAYRDIVALRGSAYGTVVNNVDPLTGAESTKFIGGERIYAAYALGVGAKMRMGDTGHLGVDLAWRPVKQYFDDTVEVGLKLSF